MKQLCLYHIEDNGADRELLALAFELQGAPIELYAACDGESAIEMLRKAVVEGRRRPDLVLLDLNLPKCSGLDVLAAIRKDPELHATKVVVLTSSDSPADRAKAEALGITGYLRKPMGFDDCMHLGAHILNLAQSG